MGLGGKICICFQFLFLNFQYMFFPPSNFPHTWEFCESLCVFQNFTWVLKKDLPTIENKRFVGKVISLENATAKIPESGFVVFLSRSWKKTVIDETDKIRIKLLCFQSFVNAGNSTETIYCFITIWNIYKITTETDWAKRKTNYKFPFSIA